MTVISNIFDNLHNNIKSQNIAGWIDHIFVSDKVSVKMVLTPPICSGDLEANLKARAFEPIPNKVQSPLPFRITSLFPFSPFISSLALSYHDITHLPCGHFTRQNECVTCIIQYFKMHTQATQSFQ